MQILTLEMVYGGENERACTEHHHRTRILRLVATMDPIEYHHNVQYDESIAGLYHAILPADAPHLNAATPDPVEAIESHIFMSSRSC